MLGRYNLLLTMEKLNYIVPDIEVIDVKIEKGFAQYDPLEDIIKKEPIGW